MRPSRRPLTCCPRRRLIVAGLGLALAAGVGAAGFSARAATPPPSRLASKQAGLVLERDRLAVAETRLRQLQEAQVSAQTALAAQLVGLYEGGRPALVQVVLASTGFRDLLDQLAFARRVERRDAQVLAGVQAARRAVATQALRVGAAAQRVGSLSRALAPSAVPAATAASAPALRPINVLPGGGVLPLPRSAFSPPATWTISDGIDIAAPAGTVEHALCTGTIILHGIGGQGRWTPVLRCDHPVAGHRDVFYGGAGPKGLAPIGARVRAGQAIARVGNGTVGADSSGPHLELGFTAGDGTPLGAHSIARLRSQLRAALAT